MSQKGGMDLVTGVCVCPIILLPIIFCAHAQEPLVVRG